jgi:hypothetical protein
VGAASSAPIPAEHQSEHKETNTLHVVLPLHANIAERVGREEDEGDVEASAID